AGISLPLEAVRRINARFGQDTGSYTSVLLRAQDSQKVSSVAAAVKKMGLELDESERNRALQIGAAVELVTVALSLLATLITALAAVNIAQAFYAEVRERTREIGVMRAVGATRGDVASLLVIEAVATGIAGGLLGVLLAFTGGWAVDALARTALPDFPFTPPIRLPRSRNGRAGWPSATTRRPSRPSSCTGRCGIYSPPVIKARGSSYRCGVSCPTSFSARAISSPSTTGRAGSASPPPKCKRTSWPPSRDTTRSSAPNTP